MEGNRLFSEEKELWAVSPPYSKFPVCFAMTLNTIQPLLRSYTLGDDSRRAFTTRTPRALFTSKQVPQVTKWVLSCLPARVPRPDAASDLPLPIAILLGLLVISARNSSPKIPTGGETQYPFLLFLVSSPILTSWQSSPRTHKKQTADLKAAYPIVLPTSNYWGQKEPAIENKGSDQTGRAVLREEQL